MDTPKETKTKTPISIEPEVVSLIQEFVQELRPHSSEKRMTLESSIDRDIGLDSLARVELMGRIEKRFGVKLDEKIAFQASTPRDLARAILAAKKIEEAKVSREIEKETAAPKLDEKVREPIQARTVIEALEWHAEHHGDRPHIYFYTDSGDDNVITYAELLSEARRMAGQLQSLDIESGDSVALMLPTGPDYFITFMAVLLAGAVPVPLYPPVRLDQIESHLERLAKTLENCRARILITPLEIKSKTVAIPLFLKSQAPDLREILTPDEIRAQPPEFTPIPKNENDLAMLQYTSGSTGQPKGVSLTHKNLLTNIRAMGNTIGASSNDVFVSWLPLYHDMGLIGAWLGSLYFAAPAVFMSPFDFLSRPSRWLWAIHRYRATLTSAPNFAYELCLKRIDEKELEGLDLSSLRFCFNGAEPVSAQTVREFTWKFSKFGLREEALTPVYGLAECTVGLTFPPHERVAPIDEIDRTEFQTKGQAVRAKADSHPLHVIACGHPLPGHEIRIVDDFGNELPDGHEGRIQFRGPSATQGYFNNPKANVHLFEDGWLNTDDLGYVVNGELYVTGRVKDVIIHAGRKIHPAELEEAIGRIPGIRKGCVVAFGTHDPKRGTERLVVIAETRETEKPKLHELKGQINLLTVELVGSAPDEVVLVPPHTILKTSSGKLRRAASREMYERGELRARKVPVWAQFLRIAANSVLPIGRRYARTIASHLDSASMWTVSALLFPPIWAMSLLAPDRKSAQSLLRAAAKTLARSVGISLKVEGLENLNDPAVAGRPVIFVANHASYADAIVLTAALPVDFSFVAKAELKKNLILRPLLKCVGTEFVERFDKQKGVEDARKVANAAKAGRSLMFFPEGTITRKAGLLPFHMGAFIAAAENNLPVIPVTIKGTRSLLRPGTWRLHRGDVSVVIGKPIVPESQEETKDSIWSRSLRLSALARQEILKHVKEPDLALEPQFV